MVVPGQGLHSSAGIACAQGAGVSFACLRDTRRTSALSEGHFFWIPEEGEDPGQAQACQ